MKTLTRRSCVVVAETLLAALPMSATAVPTFMDAVNSDTDVCSAEVVGTNIPVDGNAGAHKKAQPTIGVDAAGNPYVLWVDNRSGKDEIYYAGATAIQPPLPTTVARDEKGAVIVRSTTVENLQVQIPADALPAGIAVTDISIAQVSHPREPPGGGFGMAYSFGPSGVTFNSPVTIRIPLAGDAPLYGAYVVYRYDAGMGIWTQEGIRNPAAMATNGSYLEVQVDHFTMLMAGGVAGNDAIGGGCALSPRIDTRPIEVVLPFAAFVLALLTPNLVSRLRHRSGGTRDWLPLLLVLR